MGQRKNRQRKRLKAKRTNTGAPPTAARTATRSSTRSSTRSPGRRSSARKTATLGLDKRPRVKPADSSFGYDAIVDKKRRRPPKTTTRSEDNTLGATDRKKLIATTRDLRRNFSVAAFAIRKHLDYTSRFSFQARTGNDELDKKIEKLMSWYSQKENCDVAARHNLPRLIRLAEQSRTLDGDVFLAKLSSGKLQTIEGDRVRYPDHNAPAGMDKTKWTHGIRTAPAGKALAYSICRRRDKGGGYDYDKAIPAKYVIAHGYFDRLDQVRGISPLASAINTYQDIYEATTYALAKAKVAQLFGLVITREAPEALAPITQVTANDEDDANDAEIVDEQYEVDFGSGPTKLEMEPGDDAKIIGENTPSPAFQDFCEVSIAMALKALDIPYSFYDASSSNYYQGRGDLIQYIFSAETKRAEVVEVLNAITKWRLGLFILDGELPDDLDLDATPWDWIPAGVPWWNPLQETKADIMAVEAGLNTRTAILRGQGKDFREVAETLDREERVILELAAKREKDFPTQPPTDDDNDQGDKSKGATDGES
jgi:capsid protein